MKYSSDVLMHTLAARSAGGIEVAEGYPYNGVPAA
jgi:hypothetical protein